MRETKQRIGGRPFVEFVFMIHIAEVEHLLEISAQQKRPRDAEILNRVSVVFLMAVWQTYVEAVLDDALTKMPRNTQSIAASPTRVSTPSPDKIDVLFEKFLSIKAVSQAWRWRGMTADQARRKLRRLLTLRHEIAHKARTKTRIKRSTLLDYVHFIHRLAVCLYNSTASCVAKRTRSPVRSRLAGC